MYYIVPSRRLPQRFSNSLQLDALSVVRTASQQDRPLFATIKTLLSNAWAGKNPGLLTDIFGDSS